MQLTFITFSGALIADKKGLSRRISFYSKVVYCLFEKSAAATASIGQGWLLRGTKASQEHKEATESQAEQLDNFNGETVDKHRGNIGKEPVKNATMH